ncbi:MAG: hypothetical protein Q7T55_00020 [Solirubrobacteraceae bacterium]|nr:hypothetical protein [Solirubrobacteraceae bacterium]
MAEDPVPGGWDDPRLVPTHPLLRLPLALMAVACIGLGPVAPGAAAQAQPTTPEPTSPEAPASAPAPSSPGSSGRGPDDLPKGQCIDDAAVARAGTYAAARPGSVSFAVFEHGTLRSIGGGVPYRSASIVKAMVLVADLRRHARSGRPLSKADRARLASMIRVSNNSAASKSFSIVGRGAVLEVARKVGMRGYSVGTYWSSSQVTAADQARFFGRLHSVLPKQYRAFGRRLLRTVVRSQTWGGARVARQAGYTTLFKSGWLPRTDGWVVHQGLRLERGGCSVGIAVLTGKQRTMSAGVESIRGVVQRLL